MFWFNLSPQPFNQYLKMESAVGGNGATGCPTSIVIVVAELRSVVQHGYEMQYILCSTIVQHGYEMQYILCSTLVQCDDVNVFVVCSNWKAL